MAGGNVKNYISNPNSSFFGIEDDDVDDEEFLKNSRKTYPSNVSGNQSRYTGHSNSNPFYTSRPNDDLEQRKMQLLDKKREIEERSLSSTERSLDLLRESEQVGIATAEELQKQREQLERTEKNLDNINSTLRFTQRNIDGIKSVFGSIKNYLTKKDHAGAGPAKDAPINPIDRNSYSNPTPYSDLPSQTSNHPGLKLRGLEEETSQTSQTSLPASSRLDENLDTMAFAVANLKGLAENLGNEIVSQNDLVDNILYKADRADLTINKQNKEMNRLLKK